MSSVIKLDNLTKDLSNYIDFVSTALGDTNTRITNVENRASNLEGKYVKNSTEYMLMRVIL